MWLSEQLIPHFLQLPQESHFPNAKAIFSDVEEQMRRNRNETLSRWGLASNEGVELRLYRRLFDAGD